MLDAVADARPVPHRDRLAPRRRRRQAPAPGGQRRRRQVGGRRPASDDVVRGGVACELVHLGSLYHDDVIDDSDDAPRRRDGQRQVGQPAGDPRRRLPAVAGVGDRRLARHRGRRSAGAHDRVAVRGRDRAAAPHLRHRRAPRRATSRRSTTRPRRCSARRRASAASSPGSTATHRHAHRWGNSFGMVFQIVDDILDITDDRRAARQAGRPRHGGGRLHAARAAHAAARPRGRRGAARRCSASRSTSPSGTRRWRSCAPTTASRARSPRRGGTSTPPRPRATTCRRARPPTPCGRRRPRCSRQPSRPRSPAAERALGAERRRTASTAQSVRGGGRNAARGRRVAATTSKSRRHRLAPGAAGPAQCVTTCCWRMRWAVTSRLPGCSNRRRSALVTPNGGLATTWNGRRGKRRSEASASTITRSAAGVGEAATQLGEPGRVTLHGDDGDAAAQQRPDESAVAGADVQHQVAGTHRARRDQLFSERVAQPVPAPGGRCRPTRP